MSKELQEVCYSTALGEVKCTREYFANIITKGQNNITETELNGFLELCIAQKLNPFVPGEAYCIKYGNAPASLVVGVGAMKRRAEEHPDYLYTETGIIVQTAKETKAKDGCCLYQGEALIGGWARVWRVRNGVKCPTYREVAMAEYNSGKGQWAKMPATMIEKVAVSHALRDAFPSSFEGLYTEEEMTQAYEKVEYETVEAGGNGVVEVLISDAQYKTLCEAIRQKYSPDNKNDANTKKKLNGEFANLLDKYEVKSGRELTAEQYQEIMNALTKENKSE